MSFTKLHFLLPSSSRYAPDSEHPEIEKQEAVQAEALLEMSCTKEILSALYYVSNDDVQLV